MGLGDEGRKKKKGNTAGILPGYFKGGTEKNQIAEFKKHG
jgi:hypothetical protein